jgi:hypothetical protein
MEILQYLTMTAARAIGQDRVGLGMDLEDGLIPG